ncbi:MarR family winged helix-turn-helix transcriptional regulator [Oscillospiraceae bacterium WX1]
MDTAQLAAEMLAKTGEMMRTSWPRKMHAFLQGEMFILHFISHQSGDVLPSELSAAMKTSTARVAMALKSLEGKGLIERRIDKEDRRRVKVSMTQAGRDMITCQHGEMRRRVEQILTVLGEKDTLEYLRIVGRMIEISKNLAANQEGFNS